MTSAINYNNIDGTYPVAGQDNSSQGFRDNFTNTKNNFQVAYNEITDLQNKVLLKSPLNNGIFSNDMQGNVITNATLQGARELLFPLGSVSGTVTIDYNVGSYQTLTLAGSTTLSFANFPSTTGAVSKVKVEVTVSNLNYTLTFPASVTIGINSIAGISGSTVTFSNTGTYIFELGTSNGGTSFSIQDLLRNLNLVQGGSLTINTAIGGSSVTGITMSVSNVSGVAVGNITATNFIGNIINTGSSNASYTGNITANNIIANTGISGTLTTALQPNITLLGNLSSLSVTANANIGNLTVNGMTDMCAGTQYGLQYVSLGNGGSQQLYSNVGAVIVEFTSNISGATITMPATPVNGQSIMIGFGNNTCAALSQGVTGGQSIQGAVTAANAWAGGTWVYYSTKTTWYKVA